MLKNTWSQHLIAVVVSVSALTGCSTLPVKPIPAQRIVGAWLVRMPEAPFQYHMMIFHSDGTVLQSNPDAGDPHSSDSNGMGSWIAEGNRIVGKFVEVTADRTTRAFSSRGDIAFDIEVRNDAFAGTGIAHFYDLNGTLTNGPVPFTLSGTRVRAR